MRGAELACAAPISSKRTRADTACRAPTRRSVGCGRTRATGLEAVAVAYGVNVRKPGGSHVVFEHPVVAEAISLPAWRPIRPADVPRFVVLIEAVRASHE